MKKILVVEDNKISAQIINQILNKEYKIDMCESGELALEKLGISSKNINKKIYDIIFMDIGLLGIDGYETCKLIRSAGFLIPILFISGHDTLEERVLAFECGGNDFLSKPVNSNELKQKVKKLIESAQRYDLEYIDQKLAGEKEENSEIIKQSDDLLDELSEFYLEFLQKVIKITDVDSITNLLHHYLTILVNKFASKDVFLKVSINDENVNLVSIVGPLATLSSLEEQMLEKASLVKDEFVKIGKIGVFNFVNEDNKIKITMFFNFNNEYFNTNKESKLDILMGQVKNFFEATNGCLVKLNLVDKNKNYLSKEVLRQVKLEQYNSRVSINNIYEQVEKNLEKLELSQSAEKYILEIIKRQSDLALSSLDKLMDILDIKK